MATVDEHNVNGALFQARQDVSRISDLKTKRPFVNPARLEVLDEAVALYLPWYYTGMRAAPFGEKSR